jgi:threonylcarbamoyladenosine tRNA methylthiotransferase MtaB
VPLQSGSDSVLRAMHRWYRTGHYAERIALIRRLLPHAAIGADIVAGFPGETEADFEATRAFVARLPFTYLHVFSFSARPGTGAAKMGSAVPAVAIRERARALRALGEEKSAAFRASQAGRTVRALTLDRQRDSWTEALTANYLKVRIAGRHPANEWREVRIAADAQAVSDCISACCESA